MFLPSKRVGYLFFYLNPALQKMRKKLFILYQYVIAKYVSRSTYRLSEAIFFIFCALRDWKFYRICFVINGLKYANTSAPLMPYISGKLANCRI